MHVHTVISSKAFHCSRVICKRSPAYIIVLPAPNGVATIAFKYITNDALWKGGTGVDR